MTQSTNTPAPGGQQGIGPGDAEAQDNPAGACLAVVGVGASAGGLNAFKRLFQDMPSATGMAFVLVPHLDPRHASLMVDLIARQTAIPVCEAQDGMAIAADRIYIIPPNRYLAIEDGVLRLLTPPSTAARQTAIDAFLRSLADAYQERAVGIILSGTGAHGTLGLRAIKGRDGLAVVQDPASAEYDQMPRSAIAAGLADYVLVPEAMPAALVDYVAHASHGGTWQHPEDEAAGLGTLGRVLNLLRERTKYDFRCYRKKMLLRRVQRRLSICHLDGIDAYLDRLAADPDEPERLVRDLLIGVTGFFREPQASEALAQQVIGPLVEQADPQLPVRVWVPGCSTGEEAYTIGILLIEAVARHRRPRNIQIFATDIDEEALEVGRQGIYPESIAGDVGPERLQRFFVGTGEHRYQVAKPLREAVVFAHQNLIGDAPFSRLDLISCRNLLIYLEPEIQRKIVPLFHFALNPGGYLILGASESIGQRTDLFETISKKWRIFRRVGPTRREVLEFPLTPRQDGPTRLGTGAGRSAARQEGIADLTRRLLLEDYAPATVLIDHRYEILYLFGATSDYLDLPTGEPTRDLLALAREGLRTKLRAVCHRALQEGSAVTVADASVKRNGVLVPVQARVRRVPGCDPAERLLLVSFMDRPQGTAMTAHPSPGRDTLDESAVVKQLELELRATREDLQTTIEELENSNEELKASNEESMSMNEELQSANEELETSKEELQSLNEELTTVNNQLQDKVQELERSNNDITNLLDNTDIATVFLDPGLRIKLFTPPTARLFNLRPTDLGRPLSDFSPRFSDAGFLADAQTVLETLAPRENEVVTGDGRHLLRRIQPYRTRDDRIEGVVITFVDITNRMRSEQQLRESEDQLRKLNKDLERRIVERTRELSQREAELRTLAANVPAMFSYLDASGVYRYVNRLYEQHHGRPADQILGKSVREVLGDANYAHIKPHLDRALAGEAQRYESTFAFADGVRTMDVVYVPDKDTDGRTKGVFVLVHDITAAKALERKLHDSEERLRAIVATAADGILTIDRAGILRDFNPAAESIFGRPAATVIGHDARLLLPPGCRSCPDYPACFHGGRCLGPGAHPREITGCRADGSLFPIELTVSEIDHLGLYVVLVRDQSERKALERQIIEAATLEQERIGREIHDGIGQQLTALSMLAASIERRLAAAGRPDDAREVEQFVGHIQDALGQARALARGLSPVEVDPDGLTEALADLAGRVRATSNIDCRFSGASSLKVQDEVAAQHLYRIAQEAVHNALRHGKPRSILIRLDRDDQGLTLTVTDDGAGIRKARDRSGGLGLHIMHYRAGIIGGQLTIEPSPDGGTRVRCLVPAPR